MKDMTFVQWFAQQNESNQVNWLIELFNTTFAEKHTVLVKGNDEPEYFPAVYKENQLLEPAKIVFAHGYFSSALHEISHWCIAGHKRRQLPDFGYWYEPDGRTPEQQALFEKVEVKPQALEWIFSQICYKKFHVSADNLLSDLGSSHQFKLNVHKQVCTFLQNPTSLPTDALTLVQHLQIHFRNNQNIATDEFQFEDL